MNYKEFVEKVILGDLTSLYNIPVKARDDLRPAFRYHLFILISIGIEALGAAFDDEEWFKDRMSSVRFNVALEKLKALNKYKDKCLYNKLRCGMAHVYLPSPGLSLNSKLETYPHNKIIRHDIGLLNLQIEPFFLDFKLACNELIKKINDHDPEIKKKVYRDEFFKVGKVEDL